MHDKKTVYLISPRCGGFVNDLLIKPEGGDVLYHVKTKLFSPLRRIYYVYDAGMRQVLRSQQDHTVLFPQHTIFRGDYPIGKIGQSSLLPRTYFMNLDKSPPAAVHIGGFTPFFHLRSAAGMVAEMAQNGSTWIIVFPGEAYRFEILACIGMLYREDSLTC